MSEKSNVLSATTRSRLGSRDAARIRSNGGLPAVVYGGGKDPRPIYLPAKKAIELMEKGEKVYQMAVDGNAPDDNDYVLLRDLQFDYLGTNIVHADFSRVHLTDRVTIKCPIHFMGDAAGLKTAGAVMMHVIDELEIECQVSNIPDFVELDVSNMKAGTSLHASDIQLPKSTMKMLTPPDAVLATILVQSEVEDAGEAATAVTTGAPELVGEKKDDEGEDGDKD